METDFVSRKLHYSKQLQSKNSRSEASKNVKSRYLNNYFKIYVSISTINIITEKKK